MVILEVIIALVVLFAVALALVFQQRRFEKIAAQQEAWQHTQQSQLRTWESQQERRITNLETQLAAELQKVQQARQQWETKDVARMEEMAKEFKVATEQLRLQHELALILRIEDTPLSIDPHGQSRPSIANWRPPMLHQANLREFDLSRRYLGYADMREANLAGATLFMANLSWANLSGADLSNADLSGSDLSNADLSGAILNGTNLLVTDLHNANLTGANLLGARNFTAQQLRSTIHDSTTLLDIDTDATPPRVGKVHVVSEMASPRLETVSPEASPSPITPVPESSEAFDRAETNSFASSSTSTEQELTNPEPVAVSAPEEDMHAEELSSPLTPDTTSFIQQLGEPDSSSTSTEQELPVAELAVPDSIAVTAPESESQAEALSSPLMSDTASFIQQLPEPAPVSSLTSGDSLLDPKVADLLVDRQESKGNGGTNTASPRRKYNGKRAAKKD
jgi:hypothetical protein